MKEQGLRTIALRLAFDGTNYHGWQAQKDLATVSQTLETAIAVTVGHPVKLTGCETDAVYMQNYVANSDLLIIRQTGSVRDHTKLRRYSSAMRRDVPTRFFKRQEGNTYLIYQQRKKTFIRTGDGIRCGWIGGKMRRRQPDSSVSRFQCVRLGSNVRPCPHFFIHLTSREALELVCFA